MLGVAEIWNSFRCRLSLLSLIDLLSKIVLILSAHDRSIEFLSHDVFCNIKQTDGGPYGLGLLITLGPFGLRNPTRCWGKGVVMRRLARLAVALFYIVGLLIFTVYLVSFGYTGMCECNGNGYALYTSY